MSEFTLLSLLRKCTHAPFLVQSLFIKPNNPLKVWGSRLYFLSLQPVQITLPQKIEKINQGYKPPIDKIWISDYA
jgi:hypothetical protein